MRMLLTLVAAAATLAVPASAAAQTTYTDSVAGLEIGFTATSSTFAGRATGDLPGFWRAVVQRTPLTPNGTITGGTFTLWTLVAATPTQVTGTFAPGGSIVQTNPGAGCTNQRYTVSGALTNVAVGSATGGSGAFAVQLTHHRAFVPFLGCITYAGTVVGGFTVTVP
jgi:hypothetical protein